MAPGAGSNQPVPSARAPVASSASRPGSTTGPPADAVTPSLPPGVLPSQVERRRAVVIQPRGQLDVAVVAVNGCLGAALGATRDALRAALAGDAHAVVCDLSGTQGEAGPDTLAALAELAEYPRSWPAVPLVVAAPDDRMRAALDQQPLSRHLVVRGSVQEGLSALAAVPRPVMASVRLAPHPTAGRAARLFVSRCCLDWSMRQGLAGACLVAGEVVSNVIVRTRMPVDVSLARHQNLLRLSVRDHDSHLVRPDDPEGDRVLRRYALVEGFSRAWGIVRGPDGGRTVWAVLET
jgi:hypothetical protein